MILYHGSNTEIKKIDIRKCKPFKDFGRGFYTTPLRDQGLAMAKRTARIFRIGIPWVTEFFFDDAYFEDGILAIRRFEGPDNDWARFVINNRNPYFADIQSPECNTDSKYDIVIGPVANDDIAALLGVYLAGIISEDVLTQELTFRELSIQISFHSQKSIGLLEKTGYIHGYR